MGGKFTEIAADRPGYFNCYVGKQVKFVNTQELPAIYHNRVAKVIYQVDNFIVAAFEDCEGWAPRVCSITEIEVIDTKDCYDDTDLQLCTVYGCQCIAVDEIHIELGEESSKNGGGFLSVKIPICSDCYKIVLGNNGVAETVENVNEEYRVELRFVEKNLD